MKDTGSDNLTAGNIDASNTVAGDDNDKAVSSLLTLFIPNRVLQQSLSITSTTPIALLLSPSSTFYTRHLRSHD